MAALLDRSSDEIADVARSYDALVIGLGKTGSELTTSLAKLSELITGVIATSRRVTRIMVQTSAAVDKNAADAAQMRLTTNHVTQIVAPIAVTATQQSDSTRQAAVSTNELAHGIGQLDTTARALRKQAAFLEALVS